MFASNVKQLETTIRVIVKLLKTVVEISSHLVHVFRVSFWICGVCVTKTSSNRLIHKEDIVVLGPSIFISNNLIGASLALRYPEGAKLHQIT